MVSAIEPEFPSLEAFDDLPQGFLALVELSLCLSHLNCPTLIAS